MPLTKLNIEKEIEKKFILGMRAIFEIDNTFGYNENDTETKIMITPEYPTKDSSFRTPHAVVTNISYNFNRSTTFANNFARDVLVNGVHMGQEFINTIPYSLSIACLAEYFISKDLANTVMGYLMFDASEVFDYLSLNIQNVSKSPTSPQKQYPEAVFETMVSVQGHLEWKGSKRLLPDTAVILRRIKEIESLHITIE